MNAAVTMLVPSRGRPESVYRMAEAWEQTDPLQEAKLVWLVDADDPDADEYRDAFDRHQWMYSVWFPTWQTMVAKVNAAAPLAVTPVVGFIGDDHLPRTSGWASRLAAANDAFGPGIFYGPDGIQDMKLPTWWAMDTRIVHELGKMIPADVEHLYCDNAVLELGKAARCIWYLPEVMIEHMHPVAEKAEWDEGYRRVNDPSQYERDRREFAGWLGTDRGIQARAVRALRRSE